MTRNGSFLTLVLAGLFALIAGSYGYTLVTGGQLEERLAKRLNTIEAKIDRLIERGH